MEVKKFSDLNLYLKGFEIESIGNQAVRKAQEENRKKGIPLVYSVDGKIYYELADGTITTNSPFKSEKGWYYINSLSKIRHRNLLLWTI